MRTETGFLHARALKNTHKLFHVPRKQETLDFATLKDIECAFISRTRTWLGPCLLHCTRTIAIVSLGLSHPLGDEMRSSSQLK